MAVSARGRSAAPMRNGTQIIAKSPSGFGPLKSGARQQATLGRCVQPAGSDVTAARQAPARDAVEPCLPAEPHQSICYDGISLFSREQTLPKLAQDG
jgi:hypothetical protein